MKLSPAANRQSEAAECGLACLAVAAQMAGCDVDLQWLRQRYPVSVRGQTLKDITDIAASIGLSSRAVRCELDEMAKLTLPAILHWGLRHFVVLSRASRTHIWIFDPARGTVKLSLAAASHFFTGVALELAPSPGFERRRERAPLKMLSVVRWTPQVRSGLLQALALSLLLQLYVLASPFYIQLGIDEAAVKGDRALITVLAIAFGLFGLFNTVADTLRAITLQRISALLSWDMTRRVFHHLLRLPLPWFQRRRLADTLTRFQSLDPIRNLITNGLIGALLDGTLSITTAVLMFVFSPTLGLIALLAVVLYGSIRIAGIPSIIRLSADALLASIAEQGKRIETLRAIQTIKAMGGETKRESDWSNKFADTIATSQRSAYATIAFSSAQKLIDGLATIAIVYVGVRAIIAGHMTVGVLYAFISFRAQFSQRAVNLLEQVVSWRQLDIYTYRLSDVVLTPVEAGIDKDGGQVADLCGAIEISGLSFQFSPTDAPLLRGLNFSIGAGEFVAIVGPSGSGKSTLLKVLCGLYMPTAGLIRIDGIPINELGPKAVRRSIGVVLQDEELLPGTIAENVSFFEEVVDVDMVWRCLSFAAMSDEVREMPMKLETFVGDMGAAVSGGQKQRILLARALYKRPAMLLLDEATSHVDLFRERSINAGLKGLPITRIVVAHRPETIAAADRVLMLDRGTLHELEKGLKSASAN